MADVESRPQVSEGSMLAGPRRLAVLVATGIVFGFGIGYLVGLILNAERLMLLALVGLCVGGLAGAVVGRLMDQQAK
jgi:F0F1-type ATP synthase assembly protein I